MNILEYINSNVLDRYARWIAEEDMKRSGISVKLLTIDRQNQTTKERIHG